MWNVRLAGPAPTEYLTGLSVNPRAMSNISPSRPGMPREISLVTPDSSIARAIGFGNLALLKPPRRSYPVRRSRTSPSRRWMHDWGGTADTSDLSQAA